MQPQHVVLASLRERARTPATSQHSPPHEEHDEQSPRGLHFDRQLCRQHQQSEVRACPTAA